MDNQFFTTRNSEIKLFVVLSTALIFLLVVSFISGSRSKSASESAGTAKESTPIEDEEVEG